MEFIDVLVTRDGRASHVILVSFNMFMVNKVYTSLLKDIRQCMMNQNLSVYPVSRGLPVGFLLLRYSVLFTVECLSQLYLLVIS